MSVEDWVTKFKRMHKQCGLWATVRYGKNKGFKPDWIVRTLYVW